MTDEQRRKIERLIPICRKDAARYGPLHGGWDIIFDAEALLRGDEAIVELDQVIEWLQKWADRESKRG